VTFQKTAGGAGKRRRLFFGEVDVWLHDRRDDGLFSFENICDTLGISSSRLRSALNERQGRPILWRRRPVLTERRVTPAGKAARRRRMGAASAVSSRRLHGLRHR
jgi:hypothetical protein